jgi:hypothetical protein
MSNPAEQSPRPLTAVPVAPHGHQIQPSHQTVLPEDDSRARARLAEILTEHGEPPPADSQGSLRQLCGQFPAFLDGWGRLAQAAYASGDPVAGYAFARVGYHRGLDRLRRHGWGGTGQVRWAELGNQGFLRSLYMLMLASAAIGEEDEAARCRQFLLDLDPEDGIGVRTRPAPGAREKAGTAHLP